MLSTILAWLIFNICAPAQQGQSADWSIIPKPVSAKRLDGIFTLDGQTRLFATDQDARQSATFFNQYLSKNYGLELKLADGSPDAKTDNFILLQNASRDQIRPDGYQITVGSTGISITGKQAGLFFGVQTLIQLLPVSGQAPFRIQNGEIVDYPRFGYRGMHLDSGRHFYSVEFIKKYLDLMAQYKLNHFHWHLTEDQGWRIEIKKYPKLTEIGSRRKETVKDRQLQPYVGDGIPYGGYYTQQQIREVVAYAQERFITIIPEIEMPGHALAALAAYPELACTSGPFEVATTWGIFKDVFCPKEETFKFLEDVLTEVAALFPGPYIHVGGDECPKDRWKESEVAQSVIKREGLKDEHELQSYFIRRIEKFLQTKGKRLIGWDEILEGGLAPNAIVMSWRGKEGSIAAARQQHSVIMTPTTNCYLDYGQGDPKREPLNIGGLLPLSKVYGFDPVPAELKPEEERFILGGQANVWTEYMKTPEKAEYMVFPRMLALAEVVWSPQANRNYDDFMRRLPPQLARLDRQQVAYRIPEPSGLKDIQISGESKVKLNLTSYVPGGKIYYTLDGTDPSEQSAVYQSPIEILLQPGQKITLNLIVVTPGGRRSSVYSASLSRT
ncbi:MAG TPA: family 20 glycosylhydrolase [Blastocatellia bacterium]|nr:family 20 glycosylhydrolase [Blastocatellia bacterium]